MQATAHQLLDIVEKAIDLLNELDESKAAIRPAPDKWSQKEILGHLIDSANNNQQKFVRMMAQSHTDFVGYAQNHWVDSQHYNAANLENLIGLWMYSNAHLAHIIENVDSTLLKNTITIDGEGPFELGYIMGDYARHLEHHLNQIFPNEGFSSKFVNLYNNQ